MNKTSYLYLLAMLIAPPTWGEEEMYLEGITVLGNHKSAYLSMKEGKATVREGDMVGPWQVTRIKQNSIFLVTNKGESTELLLHSRLPIPSENSETEVELSEEQLHPDPREGLPEEEEASNETTIKSEDSNAQVAKEVSSEVSSQEKEIPKGYRKVRTPFGEIIVPEETSPTISNDRSLPPTSPETQSISEVSPGHHKIKTPFGEFVVEDKKVSSSKEKNEDSHTSQ